MKRIACLTLTAIGLLGGARGEAMREGLTRTEWGSRLAGGPLRVLFVAPYGAHQDSFELMQRFELDATVVPVAGADAKTFGIDAYYWPDLGCTSNQVFDNLRAALKTDWEALVLAEWPRWTGYPEDIRQSMLEAVQAGRGLVVGNAKLLTDAGVELAEAPLPTTRFPIDQPQELRLAAHALGRGRVLHFQAANDHRFGFFLSRATRQADFECSAARFGWLLRQTARPSTPVCILETAVAGDRVRVRLAPDRAAGGAVTLTVRDAETYDLAFSRRASASSADEVTFSLPALPGGAYQVEVVMADREERVVDWDVIRFERRGALNLAHFSADRPACKPGAPLTLKIEIEGDAADAQLELTWHDHWGRLLLRETRALSDTLALTAPAGSLSVLNHITATLVSKRGPEAVARLDMLMPDAAPRADFAMLYWNTGLADSWRQRLYYDALRRDGLADGFTNCGVSTNAARAAALAHLRTIPYAAAFHNITLAEQLFSEPWLKDMERRGRGAARAHGPHGALGYTLGDENYVSAFKPEGRFSTDDSVWQPFVEHLKSRYESLDALNRQWGAAFPAWEAVRFDSEAAMLGDRTNPSAWVDYRMFVAARLAQAYARMRRAMQEEDPGAPVGFDGAEQYSSYDGYDWWLLTRDAGVAQVYNRYFMPGTSTSKMFNGEALNSFCGGAPIRGGWLNSSDRDYGGMADVWYMLLKGWNSAWWWHGTFLHPANGAMQWTLRPTPIMQAAISALHEVKRGPAALLTRARRVVDPIAIHYSDNNWHASTLESGVGNHVNNLGIQTGFWNASNLVGRLAPADDVQRALWQGLRPNGHYAFASANAYLLLQDLGFQPRTLARQEIEAETLTRDGVRVLLLPFVVSLSAREAAAIRSFVAGGGVVIADYRCGLRDLHGRITKQGALDDVFGIVRTADGIIRGPAPVTMEYGVLQGAAFDAAFHEPLQAADARVHGSHADGTPALLVNGYGLGKAIYLNSDLYAYETLRRRGGARDIRELFRTILVHTAQLATPFPVRHPGGHALSAVQVMRFEDGAARYTGLFPDFMPDDKQPRQARLDFPAGTHVYELRERRSLGRGGTVLDTLHPGQAKLYAALPYAVEGLDLTVADTVRRGETIRIALRVRVSSGMKPARHAVQLAVSRPDNVSPEYLNRTVTLDAGTGEYAFFMALNDPRGTWSVQAVEAVSGQTAHTTFTVR